jgi:Na+-translocating ferredoxin:NAD+ oxidoreductase RnfD subunit
MVMRKMGTFEEPVCFAILLANGFRPVLDSVVDALPSVLPKRKEASVK